MKKQKGKRSKAPAQTHSPPPRARKRSAGPTETGEEAHLPWTRKNYVILGVGSGILVVGFLLLFLGDTTVAPILLVGGYLGLIPWGIIASRQGSTHGEGKTTAPGKTT
jgi:hypothetical protein